MTARRSNSDRNHGRYLHNQGASRGDFNWVRMPIDPPSHGPLIVLIYGRYSTEEQNPRSIADQIAYCQRFIATVYDGEVHYIILQDAAISGEQLSRPGIDAVRGAIAQRTCHVVVAEDTSRYFRDENACFQLFGSAVDAGIRIIGINDHVDTAEEDIWEERLHEAMRQHATANRYTIGRIRRALDSLWEIGAAIGPLKPGYLRRPTHAATAQHPAEGPHYDEIDPRWTSVIVEMFTRVARGDDLDDVAAWLTQTGLLKAHNATGPWNARNVIARIQCTTYQGVDTHRQTVSRREHATGRRRQRRNTGPIPTRPMPHLRIVTDRLWEEANQQIESRTTQPNPPRGHDHPLFGIPRDSRGPLSELFVCAICGQKMHAAGRNEGGYCCSQGPSGRCWNKTTALKSITHQHLADAIDAQLPELERRLADILTATEQLLTSNTDRQSRRQELVVQRQQLSDEADRLVEAIAALRTQSDRLVERLRQTEMNLHSVNTQLEQLDTELVTIPTLDQLAQSLRDFAEEIRHMRRETGPVLRRVISAIQAVPFQQFGSTKIVLRARFEIRVAGLLPHPVLSLLRNLYGDSLDERLGTIPLLVDLFETSAAPKYGLAALEIYEQTNRSLIAAARQLGITKPRAFSAVKYGRELRAAGLVDPFIELTERPANTGRWRYRGEQRRAA